MVRNGNRKKLALHIWHRSDFTQAAPDYECVNCHLKGHCHKSEMCREVDNFGILIKQTRQIIECRHCSNEVIVGSMDLPMGENTEARPGKFNLRKFSKDERVPPMAVVGREAKK